MRSKIVKILSITVAYCTVHCVDRDEKGKGFRPGSSFLFSRHFSDYILYVQFNQILI